jgi:hypothetical protein
LDSLALNSQSAANDISESNLHEEKHCESMGITLLGMLIDRKEEERMPRIQFAIRSRMKLMRVTGKRQNTAFQ